MVTGRNFECQMCWMSTSTSYLLLAFLKLSNGFACMQGNSAAANSSTAGRTRTNEQLLRWNIRSIIDVTASGLLFKSQGSMCKVNNGTRSQ